MVLYCLHTLVVCGSRLKRGLTLLFLAAGGHTHHPMSTHIYANRLSHTQMHVYYSTHTFTHSFISRQHNRNSPFCGFPSFVESRLFPSGHAKLVSRRWKTEAQLKVQQLAGIKKPCEFMIFSSQDLNPSHCRTQANEKVLLQWSCGDPLHK